MWPHRHTAALRRGSLSSSPILTLALIQEQRAAEELRELRVVVSVDVAIFINVGRFEAGLQCVKAACRGPPTATSPPSNNHDRILGVAQK